MLRSVLVEQTLQHVYMPNNLGLAVQKQYTRAAGLTGFPPCHCLRYRGTSEKSYVLPVYHQAYGNQPYPRSAQSQAMSITLGSSAGNKVPYKFTVDTGSGVLLATCRSPQSLANCNNDLPANRNYEISPATTVSDAATCTSTGIGCLLSPSEGGSNKCHAEVLVRAGKNSPESALRYVGWQYTLGETPCFPSWDSLSTVQGDPVTYSVGCSSLQSLCTEPSRLLTATSH